MGSTFITGAHQWVSISNDAQFNNSLQKKLYVKYWNESLYLSDHPLELEMCSLAKKLQVMFM